MYYGSWNLSGHRKGETLTADSWSGPEPAPKVVLKDFDNTVSRSACKNLPSNWRGCGSFTLEITVQSDDYGCPWLASSHIVATTFITNETYSPPDTRSSVCPKVPVDTFDISWDANVSKQKTTLMLDATGGTVNRTLHTYLMEGGNCAMAANLTTVALIAVLSHRVLRSMCWAATSRASRPAPLIIR